MTKSLQNNEWQTTIRIREEKKKKMFKKAGKKDDELTLYRREIQAIERHHSFKTCCKHDLPHHKWGPSTNVR